MKVFKPIIHKGKPEKKFKISRCGDLFNPATGRILAKDRNCTTVLIDGERVFIDKKKMVALVYGEEPVKKQPRTAGLKSIEIMHNHFNAGKFDPCYN